MEENLLKNLHALAQLDRDAVGAYDDALERVTDDAVKEHFTEFRGEHMNHVEKLSRSIERLGGTAPQLEVVMMGMVAEWIVSFRSMMGEKGPLHAMHIAETYHNSRYAEAASWNVGDDELAALIQTFYGDEKEHLRYIDEMLAM